MDSATIRHYIKKLDSTHKQWLGSDIIIFVVCLILFIVGKRMSDLWSAIIILAIAIVASIADYFLNMRFYFPKSETPETLKANT